MDLNAALTAAAAQNLPVATLYVVATPIGNLADITVRALAVLEHVDRIAAEDTRVARRLIEHFGLSKPLVSAHQHNEGARAADIIEALAAGERIAYISDAGTPALSDPGATLVAAVRAAGYRVVPIPGASALATAISAIGFPEGPIHFAGFLPQRERAAAEALARLATVPAHLVIYEAPHRVKSTVELCRRLLGPGRRLAVARELTKMFEEIAVMPLAEGPAWFDADPHRLKGEFVLVVERPAVAPDGDAAWRTVLGKLVLHLPLSEAVALTVEVTGAARNAVYEAALALRRDVG